MNFPEEPRLGRIQIGSHPDEQQVPVSVHRVLWERLTRPIGQRRMLLEGGSFWWGIPGSNHLCIDNRNV